MWSIVFIIGLFVGGYYALSYKESMISNHKNIQQERIKNE